jgi:hypothetical protein
MHIEKRILACFLVGLAPLRTHGGGVDDADGDPDMPCKRKRKRTRRYSNPTKRLADTAINLSVGVAALGIGLGIAEAFKK